MVVMVVNLRLASFGSLLVRRSLLGETPEESRVIAATATTIAGRRIAKLVRSGQDSGLGRQHRTGHAGW